MREKYNIQVKGEGNSPLLFVHGFGCDQTMWRLITPHFEKRYKIVLFDLMGFGKSDITNYDFKKYDTLQGHADGILEICDFLNLKNVVLVGHSVSAMIGMLACIRRPELFSKLIMVGPSPSYINDEGYTGGFTREAIHELLETIDSNYLGWSSTMAPAIMGNAEKPELAEELTNSFCRTNPAIARHFARVTFMSDVREDLKQLTTQTLIMQCSSDVIAPESVGQYLSREIKHNQFVQLNATGHCPHLSSPAETIEAIEKFLQA